METSPALEQAELFESVARHLRAHPHLPRVSPGYGVDWIPIRDGEAEVAVAWAKTLTNAQFHPVKRVTDFAKIEVSGGLIDGTEVEMWAADQGAVSRWLGPHEQMPISLDQLEALVAKGVERVGS